MTTDSRTVAAYDRFAKDYHSHVKDAAHSPLHEYYEKPSIQAQLPNLTGQSVLSIGCASGEETAWLMQQGAKNVTGIDISKELIKIAQATYPAAEFRVMDMEQLDFDDSAFDHAYSSLVMHYVSDWPATLSEIFRVVRTGGHFVFSCNHPLETSMESYEDNDQRGVHIGRRIDQVTQERTMFGDYMAAQHNGVKPRASTVADKATVYSYHRTFGSMLNTIIESGFQVVRVVEPLPLQAMKKDNLEHYKQVMSQPKFIIWHLVKP